MRVTKVFQWDAAHQLFLPYESKCNSLHGHTYLVEIELEGLVNEDGMVMDFADLKRIVEPASFDHKHLNSIPWFAGKNPTAENIVLYLKDVLDRNWKPQWANIRRIRVYETPTSFAEEEW
jgi:6-pyruvoyltetrahydropterin/6-carboxytetrahydropterin synthase